MDFRIMTKKKTEKKDVCLERSQMKTLFDVIRGTRKCDAADEFIEEIDVEFEESEKKKKKKKKKKSLLDAILKEAEELFKE